MVVYKISIHEALASLDNYGKATFKFDFISIHEALASLDYKDLQQRI